VVLADAGGAIKQRHLPGGHASAKASATHRPGISQLTASRAWLRGEPAIGCTPNLNLAIISSEHIQNVIIVAAPYIRFGVAGLIITNA